MHLKTKNDIDVKSLLHEPHTLIFYTNLNLKSRIKFLMTISKKRISRVLNNMKTRVLTFIKAKQIRQQGKRTALE